MRIDSQASQSCLCACRFLCYHCNVCRRQLRCGSLCSHRSIETSAERREQLLCRTPTQGTPTKATARSRRTYGHFGHAREQQERAATAQERRKSIEAKFIATVCFISSSSHEIRHLIHTFLRFAHNQPALETLRRAPLWRPRKELPKPIFAVHHFEAVRRCAVHSPAASVCCTLCLFNDDSRRHAGPQRTA